MIKFNFTAIFVALLLCLPASAQRTMEGRPFVDAGFIWAGNPGGQVRAGQYLRHSLWDASIGYRSYAKQLSTGDRLDFVDITAAGSWQWRLLSLRSRTLSLYTGAGAFVGYEMYDPWHTLPETVDLGFGKGSVIYGISADVSAEVFFCPRWAFVFGARVPLVFPSHAGILRWEASAGIRFDM